MDNRALFLHTPTPLMVMDTALVIRDVNQAYLKVTGRARDTVVGHYVFDAFPVAEGVPDESPQQTLMASFQRVLDTAETDVLPLLHYQIPRLDEAGAHVGFDDRYWSCTHVPLFDEAGALCAVLQQTEDVTALQRLKQQAEKTIVASEPETARVLGGTVLRRAQQVQQRNSLLDAELCHLRQLFAQAPGFMAVLRGVDLTVELVNDEMSALTGWRPLQGLPFFDALPELAGQGLESILREVWETGAPYVGRGLHTILNGVAGAAPRAVVVNLTCQPVIEDDGTISGIFLLGQDISEQLRAEDELARYRAHLEDLVLERTFKLSELAGHLQAVSERERHRLARELHDELGSLLTAIRLDLSWTLRKLRDDDEPLRERLNRAMGLLGEGITLKRRLIEDLRPSALIHLGLNEALQMLVDDHATRQSCQYRFDAELVPRVDDEAALALYRIAQEALNNAAKYANAASIAVQLKVEAGWVVMRVRDDGVGCDPSLVRSRPVGHHGWIGMEHRVLPFGGELAICSSAGAGCEITARLPLPRVVCAAAA
ncbi:PAS domain-containing protein [Chitinibacteraceae bacterium HSL-7]